MKRRMAAGFVLGILALALGACSKPSDGSSGTTPRQDPFLAYLSSGVSVKTLQETYVNAFAWEGDKKLYVGGLEQPLAPAAWDYPSTSELTLLCELRAKAHAATTVPVGTTLDLSDGSVFTSAYRRPGEDTYNVKDLLEVFFKPATVTATGVEALHCAVWRLGQPTKSTGFTWTVAALKDAWKSWLEFSK